MVLFKQSINIKLIHIIVIFDSTHLQLANVEFYFDILNDEEFQLKVDCERSKYLRHQRK